MVILHEHDDVMCHRIAKAGNLTDLKVATTPMLKKRRACVKNREVTANSYRHRFLSIGVVATLYVFVYAI